jgi:hypothetical protein
MPRIYLGTGPARAAADDRKVSVDIAHPSARALLAELEEVVARAQFEVRREPLFSAPPATSPATDDLRIGVVVATRELAAGHPFWAPVPVELVVRASS